MIRYGGGIPEAGEGRAEDAEVYIGSDGSASTSSLYAGGRSRRYWWISDSAWMAMSREGSAGADVDGLDDEGGS